MIGYAPLEPLIEPSQFRPSARAPASRPFVSMHLGDNTTECNYLVMFFVIGVLGLAIKDMTSK
jgi:hypothetical protein